MALLPLGLALAVCTSGATAAPAYLSGRVVASATGDPVSGADLELFVQGKSQGKTQEKSTEPVAVAQSLPNGAYVLKLPGPGPYRLWVTHADFRPLEQVVTTGYRKGPLNLLMQAEDALRLRLFGPDHRPVMTGAVETWIWIWRGGAIRVDRLFRQRAPQDGAIKIVQPVWTAPGPASQFEIGIRSLTAGCALIHSTLWPKGPLTVLLQPGCTLTGRVIDSARQPLQGCRVDVLRILEDNSFSSLPEDDNPVSDANGRFTMPALFPGRYLIRTGIADAGIRYRVVTLSQPRTEVSLSPDDKAWPPRG